MDPVLARLLWAALLGMAVGAMLGVLLAAMGKRRRHVQSAERHALLASFRYALGEDPEGTIEELTRVAAEDPGGVETWFALGSLLRRKGDHARAIRIHETLIGNQKLHPSVRRAAVYELAVDFRRAGMLGRATEALERLLSHEPDHREALRELREICEDQQDWPAAVAAQERLHLLEGGGGRVLAHLHAAHARQLLAAGDPAGAAAAVDRALAADPESADARAALAAVRAAAGDGAGAAAALAEALDRRPDIAAIATEALEALPDPEGFLAARLELHPDHPWLTLARARHLRREGRASEAMESLRRLLGARPHLAEARQVLADLLLAEAHTVDTGLRHELARLVDGLGRPERPFACSCCRVELVGFTFRCPRCFGWDTVEPQVAAAGRPVLPSEGPIRPDRRTGT